MTDPVTESARATQEIAKATGEAIGAAREAGGFISRFVAGPLEQGVGIFEDKLRYLRWERQVRLMKRAEEFLRSVGLEAPTRPVALKIAIPLLQAASVEENDELQDRWVNLLVNAANKDSGVEIQRAYVEILEQISPLEARILDVIYSLPFEKIYHDGVVTCDLPNSARPETEEDHKTEPSDPPVEIKLAIANLARVGCLKQGATYGGGENFRRVNPTLLGKSFVEACRLSRPT
jgi:hypothetical protein